MHKCVKTPRTEAIDEPPNGSEELNPGPLQKQQVYFTTEPSLRPMPLVFKSLSMDRLVLRPPCVGVIAQVPFLPWYGRKEAEVQRGHQPLYTLGLPNVTQVT